MTNGIAQATADFPDQSHDSPRSYRRLCERRNHLRESRWAYVVVACVLTVAFVLLSIALGHHRRHDPRIMLGDETAHIDYALDLRASHVPTWGDRLSQKTLRIVACANQHTRASCQLGYRNPAVGGADGYSYEAQQPPLAYIPYALVATSASNPQQALLDIRRGGMIWTIAAGGVLLALALVEELSIGALSVLLAVTLMCPQFFEWAATVTNDSAGAFAGGFGLLAVAVGRRWRGPTSFSLGLATGVVLGLLKGLFIVVPVALVLQAFFVSQPWKRTAPNLRTFWRSGAVALGMLAGTAAAYGGFVLLQDERSTVAPSIVNRALLGFLSTDHLHLHTVVASFLGLTTVFLPSFVPDSVSSGLYTIWNLAMMGVVVGAIMARRTGEDGRQSTALGLGILGAAVGLAILWPVSWSLQGFDLGTPSRYAIPLSPLIGLLLVRSASRKAMWTMGLALPIAAAIAQFSVLGY